MMSLYTPSTTLFFLGLLSPQLWLRYTELLFADGRRGDKLLILATD